MRKDFLPSLCSENKTSNKPGSSLACEIKKIITKYCFEFDLITYFAIYYLPFLFVLHFPFYDGGLTSSAKEINKNCPKIIDQFIRLDNTMSVSNNCFQYNYTLVTHTVSDINLDTIEMYIRPNIINNIKTSLGLNSFRNNNITLRYNYRDKDGAFIIKYIVAPNVY